MTWFKKIEKKIVCPSCKHENLQEIEINVKEKDLGTEELEFKCGGCGKWLAWKR